MSRTIRRDIRDHEGHELRHLKKNLTTRKVRHSDVYNGGYYKKLVTSKTMPVDTYSECAAELTIATDIQEVPQLEAFHALSLLWYAPVEESAV